jgi:hypothetical protein
MRKPGLTLVGALMALLVMVSAGVAGPLEDVAVTVAMPWPVSEFAKVITTVRLSVRRFKSEVQQCSIDGMAE